MAITVAAAIDDHVKRRLEDTFGKAVAMMIFASATTTARVGTSSDLSVGEYQRLIDAICCDQRVLDMWGEAEAEQARREWERLV